MLLSRCQIAVLTRHLQVISVNLKGDLFVKYLLNCYREFHASATKHFLFGKDYIPGRITPELHGRKPTHIIIGAGSAGCVLANRLTENSDNRVLLLEAGPRDYWWNWKFHMPAALMYNLCDDKYNWYYHTLAQKHMNDRVIYWPRGRVWGGSSTLNAMVYIRGHPYDYDRWEREGAVNWSFRHVLPYFKKAQNHELSIGANDAYRGHDGPLRVMQGSCQHPLHGAFLEAGQQCGLGYTADCNGFKQEGVGPFDLTIYKGKRWSASRAYLWPALNRPNLHVSSGILCTRILFSGKQAIGVEYIRQKKFYMADNIDSYSGEKVYCEESVILAGGAINTPQLLMLSGVGPADHLQSLNIPLVQHMPGVGMNLQDHLEVYVQQKCKKPITLYDKSSWRFPHNLIKTGLQWFCTQKGPGASSHLESGGFARSSAKVPHPDIQIHFLPSTVHDDGRTSPKCHAFQVHIGPVRPKSTGRLGLSSADPRRHPIMDPNYLGNEEDCKDFRFAVKLAREIFAQKAFDQYRDEELSPGRDCVSEKQIDEFVRQKSASAYHPSCTCKMGSSNDPYAVVDPLTMGVHGLENLHVADASVMPSVISGNLNAPVIMIGERAADLIQGKQPLEAQDVPIWSP